MRRPIASFVAGLLAFTVLAAGVTAAADPIDPIGRDCTLPAGALSFPTAVDYALCRNPTTRAAWAAAREQAAALGVAKSALYPNVSVTGAETRTSGQHVDTTGTHVDGWSNTGDATINLNWTSTISEPAVDVSPVRAVCLTRRSDGKQRGTANRAGRGAELLRCRGGGRQSDRRDGHSRGDGKKPGDSTCVQQGGVGTLADVLQAQTADDQAVITRVQAEASTKTARGTLNATLGLNADHPLQLETDPVPTQVPALSARMAQLMTEAEQQRPDLAAARAQRDAAKADVRVARAEGLPSISVGAQHSFINITDQPNQNFNQFGVTLIVPIFTGFSTVYSVRQAKAVLEQREDNAEQVRLAVSQDVWNAYYSLDSANQQLSTTAALVKTAADNQEVAAPRASTAARRPRTPRTSRCSTGTATASP